MKRLKETIMAVIAAASLSDCALNRYYANIGEEYSCGRDSSRDFAMYRGRELVAKKIPNKHFDDRVYDFFEKGKKLGRFRVLPSFSYEWEPVQKSPDSIGKALELYDLVKKCEEAMRDKYKKEFDTFDEY